MSEWVLLKNTTVEGKKIDVPIGFFGQDQKSAFEARIYHPGSFAGLR